MNWSALDWSILGLPMIAGLLVLATHVPLGTQVLERGIVFAKGPANLRNQMPSLLEDVEQNLTPRMRKLLDHLWQEWKALDSDIETVSQDIETIASQDAACQRLRQIPGVGPLVSTATVAAIGNGAFRKGREFAAWMGVVPREYSTGGKQKLLGISKRGNSYLRRLFVQCARAVLQQRTKQDPRLKAWLEQLTSRTHHNVAAVALANKLARIAWAVLATGKAYRPLQLAAA